MRFLLSDSFTSALARLPAPEAKAVKATVVDLQIDPTGIGLSFHRIDKSKDPNFWSVRVSRDLRLIVHKTENSLLVAYVDHHNKAYAWAERRRIEAHPSTGAIQIVEVRERVEEVAPAVPSAPVVSATRDGERRLFAPLGDAALLSAGVPADWLDDVRSATENSFFDLAEHLPAEAAEALLLYATVGTLPMPLAPIGPDPYAHPDALRRIRLIVDEEELQQALDYPWEKWGVFLHPSQRAVVERRFAGPARVSGSAGTGKTVVALHRAVRLEHDEIRSDRLGRASGNGSRWHCVSKACIGDRAANAFVEQVAAEGRLTACESGDDIRRQAGSQSGPLALCDARSFTDDDLIARCAMELYSLYFASCNAAVRHCTKAGSAMTYQAEDATSIYPADTPFLRKSQVVPDGGCVNDSSRNNAPKTRGRPFAKGNAGRPKGARHRTTRAAEALLDGEAEALTRKAIDLALGGDTIALRLCLERVIPPRRERSVEFSLPALQSGADTAAAMAAIMEAAATGKILLTEAAEFAKLLETYMRALEMTDFEQRLRFLEASNATRI